MTGTGGGRRSPDANWRDPRFAARRLLRRPTAPLDAYVPITLDADQRARLAAAARAARRPDTGRVTFVFGTMPRSGTNFLERLLDAHPGVAIGPGGLRELPFLPAAAEIRRFEERLADFYPPNAEHFAPFEWLAYAMAGFVAAITADAAPRTEVTIVKDPHMRHVGLFDAVLPEEKAFLVMRDGRYLIDSTIRTWPLKTLGRTFRDVCLEWAAATQAALDYAETAPPDRVRLVRYESLVGDGPATMTELFGWLGLDPAAADAQRIAAPPILGSSTHSREDGDVNWKPVEKSADFDPTGRRIGWTDAQWKTFWECCGPVQERAGYENKAR